MYVYIYIYTYIYIYIYTHIYIYSLLESIRILISPWSSDYNPIIFMVYPIIIPLKTTHSTPISPESPHKTGRIHIQNAKTAGSRHPKRSPLRAVHGRGAAHLKLTKVSAPGRTRGEKNRGWVEKNANSWNIYLISYIYIIYDIIYIYICMCVWTYIYIYICNIIIYIYRNFGLKQNKQCQEAAMNMNVLIWEAFWLPVNDLQWAENTGTILELHYIRGYNII